MNLDALTQHAAEIEQAQRRARHAERSHVWHPTATAATSLGYRCERRTCYQRLQPEMAAPIGEELASIFREGDLHQADVRRELSALGYEVVEAEVKFRDDRLDIVGVIDGKVELPDPSARRGRSRVPAEIKSWAGVIPTAAEGMRDDEGLMARYYAQMQAYLFLTSDPLGLFIFKSKMTGLWRVLPTALDFGYTEGLLQRAERIRDAVRGGELLPRLADRGECGRCPFCDTVCLPAEEAPDPLLLANDRNLIAALAAREETKPTRDGWERVDKDIKTRFKMTAGERFVCGPYLIQKKKHGRGVRIDISRLAESQESEG